MEEGKIMKLGEVHCGKVKRLPESNQTRVPPHK